VGRGVMAVLKESGAELFNVVLRFAQDDIGWWAVLAVRLMPPTTKRLRNS